MIAFICSTMAEADDRAYILWIYEEFGNLMLATARKYVREQMDCEDIIQDALVSLIGKVQTLRGLHGCILASYIVSTIRNTAINHLKRKKVINEHTISIEDKYSELESKAVPVENMMMLIEHKAHLSKIWPQLSQEHRLLLEGKYILGQSDEQLAKQLHCKTSSVRMKMTRARRRALRLLINEESGEESDKT